MKAFSITTLALVPMGWAMAQDVPPLPPMRGDAASLKDTMKFIQDKLPGKVNLVVYQHDNVTGTDGTPTKQSFEVSDVSADASRCYIRWHIRADSNGKNSERDGEIFLKQVREVVPTQLDAVMQRNSATGGHPEVSTKVDPPIFVVLLKGEKASKIFRFYDDTLADRVSKALQHAVELCGGGNQEPF